MIDLYTAAKPNGQRASCVFEAAEGRCRFQVPSRDRGGRKRDGVDAGSVTPLWQTAGGSAGRGQLMLIR